MWLCDVNNGFHKFTIMCSRVDCDWNDTLKYPSSSFLHCQEPRLKYRGQGIFTSTILDCSFNISTCASSVELMGPSGGTLLKRIKR